MKKCIYIGIENARTMDDIYGIFEEALDMPEYFGRNLDALHDCLCEVSKELCIVLADSEKLSEQIPKYKAFLRMLKDTTEENPSVYIRIV